MQGKRVKLGNEHWYKHVLKFVEASHEGKVTISWKQQVQIDRTIPNNKPDIIICANEKEHVCSKNAVVSGEKKCDQEAKTILKYKHLTIKIQCMWKVKTSDSSNNRGNWNHLKVTQKIPEFHPWTTQPQETTENGHIGHRAHTSQSTNGQLKIIYHGKEHYMCHEL
jgi:hypothetical protein